LDSPSDRIVPYVLYISVQKSLAIRERRLPDLDRIEDCLLSAPNSAEIFVVAAESYAWASFISQNDPDQLDRYLRQSLELYTRAAQEGLTSDDLQFIEQLRELSPKLEQRLHELPEWERLCSMARSHREKEYPSSLLNPLL
jgi:hypothetical protein